MFAARLAVAAVTLLGAGCTPAPRGPESIRIDAVRYHDAFDAAVAAAREHDLPALLRDRRDGVIETGPAIAPSLFEPWVDDGTRGGDRLANTVAFRRRWARFEFSAPGSDWTYEASPETLTGADILGLGGSDDDRTARDGELELRVSVFLEQGHQPGLRRSTWSRSAASVTEVYLPGDDVPLPNRFWTPVRRDPDFERRLLARVEALLGADTDTDADAE